MEILLYRACLWPYTDYWYGMVVAAVVALRVYAVQQKLVLWPAGDVAFMPSCSLSSPVLCVDYALHTTTADCGMPDLDSSSG